MSECRWRWCTETVSGTTTKKAVSSIVKLTVSDLNGYRIVSSSQKKPRLTGSTPTYSSAINTCTATSIIITASHGGNRSSCLQSPLYLRNTTRIPAVGCTRRTCDCNVLFAQKLCSYGSLFSRVAYIAKAALDVRLLPLVLKLTLMA